MTTLQVSAQKQLLQLIEQIERLEEEKKALAGDIRDKFAEAKGLGFDVKVMRKVISLRKKTRTEREEEDFGPHRIPARPRHARRRLRPAAWRAGTGAGRGGVAADTNETGSDPLRPRRAQSRC